MSPLWKNKHISRCSDLREDAALMAAYHTSLSAHVCLALVCSSNVREKSLISYLIWRWRQIKEEAVVLWGFQQT